MNWRTFALRRVLGRLRIGPDIVRHLSTFQRLGATIDATPPTEVLPVGARTVLRAVRTRGAVDIAPDWVWPRWLVGQLDPGSPAFTPRGHLPVIHNVTQRNWTAVGNPGSMWEAIVDSSGLVTTAFDGWSLDWWVRASGDWRYPSREAGIRQSLLGTAPVVVTSMDVDGGAVLHRAYAVESVPEMVVVEVENATAGVVEMAFAVRPYNPEGLAVIERLAVDGRAVRVDDKALVMLPSPPTRAALSSFRDGDCAHQLDDHLGSAPTEVRCTAGLAQAAFVYPLPPGQRARALVPIAGRAPRPRLRLPWRRATRAPVADPALMPDAEQVAAEWSQRMERGLRVELPDRRLQEAVDANRAYLLLLHDPGSITAGPSSYHRFWFRDAAYQVAALDRWGLHAEAADVLRSYPGRQQPDGFFYSQWREWDANGAAIWTIAEHHRLIRDDALLDELSASVARGARWLASTCANDAGKTPEARGLLPAGISAEHFGPYDYYYWDDFWGWRGLLDAAAIARWGGDEAGAAAATEAAERLRVTLFAALERSADRVARRLITAGPERGVDAGMVGGLAACWPLGLLAHDDPWITGTLEAIRERFTIGEAFYQGIAHTGLGTYLTLQLAFVELLGGDPRAWRRLTWLLDAATPTHTWPEAIHPQLPGGCMGDGHHGWMAADLLSFVRTLLVREDGDDVALLSLLPQEWHGQRVAVHGAPTHNGQLTYELGWDGDEAVLRWEQARAGTRLRAPGLDPSWSTTERTGEVRLRPVESAAKSA